MIITINAINIMIQPAISYPFLHNAHRIAMTMIYNINNVTIESIRLVLLRYLKNADIKNNMPPNIANIINGNGVALLETEAIEYGIVEYDGGTVLGGIVVLIDTGEIFTSAIL